MVLFTRENGVLKVFAETYRLEFAKDRPYVYLDDETGTRLADLFVLSSIHPMNGRDDTVKVEAWRAEEGLGEVVFWLETTSTAWTRKIIRFRCQPRRFLYEVEVTGQAELAEALYFGGYSSASLRWGSGFFWSGQRFQQGFNPEPTCDETYTFPAEATSAINMTGVPLPGRGDWFFTPPPYCFGVETGAGWMGLGVEARPGENSYTDYHYHGSRGAFYLSLNYEGHTRIDGVYRLPVLAFDFARDPYSLLAAHVQHLRGAGLIPNPGRQPRPDWWSEPIYCGWGSQVYQANLTGGRAPDFATQASYDSFLDTLERQAVQPGTVVLDDKWQDSYGENEADPIKWPDLPGFITRRHAAGQRVLLWLKAWDPEGVPDDECITNAAGLPLAVDPTNPAYEARLRASVRNMLSPHGYDADGFKIDFSARIPSGPGIRAHGSLWGLELMRRYLSIIYDEAKRTKPDALVITHTPHPYLADLLDVVRLNDINTGHDVCRQMTHRARVATIACPEALIDTDNWPIQDKAAWRAYLLQRPMLGIPALYYASHIDSTGEPLTDEDYALLRETWASYRSAAADHQSRPPEAKISELGGAFLTGAGHPFKRLALHTILPVADKPLKTRDSRFLRREA